MTLEIRNHGIICAVFINNIFIIEFENYNEAVLFCKNIFEAVGQIKFNDFYRKI